MRTHKILAAARLLSGNYTPGVMPHWTEQEPRLAAQWLKGDNLPGERNALESALQRFLRIENAPHLFNYGRTALQAVLECLDLPPGSEVILPSFACRGVALPVLRARLKPVLADVDEYFNLDLESVRRAHGPAVRALILPHLSGLWARDTERILDWADGAGVFVIEDAAQSLGLEVNGHPSGTIAAAGVFSSHGGKPATAPAGGWVVTRQQEMEHRLSALQTQDEPRAVVDSRLKHFMDFCARRGPARGAALLGAIRRGQSAGAGAPESAHPILHRISPIDAALTRLQIERLPAIAARRAEHDRFWRGRLAKLPLKTLRLLPETNNCFAYTLVYFKGPGAERESARLRHALWAHGVETEASYTPLHLRPPLDAARRAPLPVTEQQWRGAFYAPSHPALTQKDLARIDRALASLRA